MCASGLIMDAACAMTRFAAYVFSVGPVGFQPGMRRRPEIAHDLGMTFGARLRSDKFRTGNLGRGDDRARRRGTGDQDGNYE